MALVLWVLIMHYFPSSQQTYRSVSLKEKRHRSLVNLLALMVTPKVAELDFEARQCDHSLASCVPF